MTYSKTDDVLGKLNQCRESDADCEAGNTSKQPYSHSEEHLVPLNSELKAKSILLYQTNRPRTIKPWGHRYSICIKTSQKKQSIPVNWRAPKEMNDSRNNDHNYITRWVHALLHGRDQVCQWDRPVPRFPGAFRDRTSNDVLYRARGGKDSRCNTTCIPRLAFLPWHLVAPPHPSPRFTRIERSRPGVGAEGTPEHANTRPWSPIDGMTLLVKAVYTAPRRGVNRARGSRDRGVPFARLCDEKWQLLPKDQGIRRGSRGYGILGQK